MAGTKTERELLPIVDEKLLSITELAARKVREHVAGESEAIIGLRVKAEMDA